MIVLPTQVRVMPTEINCSQNTDVFDVFTHKCNSPRIFFCTLRWRSAPIRSLFRGASSSLQENTIAGRSDGCSIGPAKHNGTRKGGSPSNPFDDMSTAPLQVQLCPRCGTARSFLWIMCLFGRQQTDRGCPAYDAHKQIDLLEFTYHNKEDYKYYFSMVVLVADWVEAAKIYRWFEGNGTVRT